MDKVSDRTFPKPRVEVINTDMDVLEIIQEWVGGNITSSRVRIVGRKQLHVLGWYKQSTILDLLKLVEPYLIIKKPQAQLLIAWCVWRQCGDLTHSGSNGDIVDLLTKSNRRGDS